MTLRDIGEASQRWMEAGAAAVERDLRIVFNEHVIDWPLWTLLAAGVVGYIALIMAVGFLAWLAGLVAYLARPHLDQDGKMRLGVVIAARSFVGGFFRSSILAAAFLAFAFWVLALGNLATGQGSVWLSAPVVIVGALICAALAIAARRGRRLRRLEKSGGAAEAHPKSSGRV